jgi:V/A-type H+-transporting ATPase subunit E
LGLDEVAEEILAAGRASAEAVLKEAEQQSAELTSEAREKARATGEEKFRQAEKRAYQLRVQELASAELEGKRARLVMEREILEAASEKGRSLLASIPRDQDERMLAEIIKKYASPGYRVFSAAKNESFLRSMPSVEYGGNVPCLGGILFESRDGSVRMDYTYDTMLHDLVERNMKEIARILFSG